MKTDFDTWYEKNRSWIEVEGYCPKTVKTIAKEAFHSGESAALNGQLKTLNPYSMLLREQAE